MESSELITFAVSGFILLMFLFLWISKSQMRSTMQKKIEDLEKNLDIQLKHAAIGNGLILRENENLKERNENLRVTVKALQMKPGRADLKKLHIFEKAARSMTQSALGTAWERAIVEAEKEIEDANTGAAALIFRKVRSMLPQGYDVGGSD